MSQSEQPEQNGGSWKFFARPVVRACDHCARVQDGSAEDALEAPWVDRTIYMTGHCFSDEDVWWFQTTCETCQRSIGRRAGCGHGT